MEVREGPDEGLAPAVSRGEKLTVGSAEGNTLRLGGDRAVSRYHLEMTPGPSSVTVRDLGSTNGTELDGKPLSLERTPLEDTSVLTIGRVRIEVKDGGKTPDSVTSVVQRTVIFVPDQARA